MSDTSNTEDQEELTGGCIASCHITKDGKPVGFMYRDKPEFSGDSGWRFMSGEETEHYTSNPDNAGIYDIDTITALDQSIIPFLDALDGTAFEKSGDSFIPLED